MIRALTASLLSPVPGRGVLAVQAGLYSLSAGLLKLLGFVLFLWIASRLDVRDYARFGVLYALQTGLSMLVAAGIVEAAVGRLKEHPDEADRRDLLRGTNSAFVVMAAPLSAFAIVAAIGLEIAAATWVTLFAVVISGVLAAYAALQSQIVRLDEKHLASLAFTFLVPLGGLIGGFVAFRAHPSPGSFFVGSAAGFVGLLCVMPLVGLGEYGFGRSGYLILRGVVPYFCIAIFGWLGGYGNTYAVEWLFPAREVAGFTFLMTVSSIMQLMATATNQVWSPRFFRIAHDSAPADVERSNRRFFTVQGVVLGVTGGAIMVFYPLLISWVGGNLTAYRSLGLELFILICGYLVLSPWWHCYNYYVLHGHGPEAMRIILGTSAPGIAIWIALMWAAGPIGIYVGFFVQMLLRMLAIVWFARRRWPVTIAWEGVAVGVALSAAGYALAISWTVVTPALP